MTKSGLLPIRYFFVFMFNILLLVKSSLFITHYEQNVKKCVVTYNKIRCNGIVISNTRETLGKSSKEGFGKFHSREIIS
jgi:hypothetical protein